MYSRAVYKEHGLNGGTTRDWSKIKDPVGNKKFDGANFWLSVEQDGAMRFHSRRPSVKGGFPERTDSLPHITAKKMPEYAGQVFNVELIHSGHSKNNVESPRAVSGVLLSLPPKAIATQQETGPVRVVLHNVIEPSIGNYKEKLLHMKGFERAFGNPDLLYVTTPAVGIPAIVKLIDSTKDRGEEGVIVTSLTEPETKNPRIKILHKLKYNLRVIGITQEFDKNGVAKESAGALICADSTGREVANVGTGFSREMRGDIWNNKDRWMHSLVRVETKGLAARRLKSPVFEGVGDGDCDQVE